MVDIKDISGNTILSTSIKEGAKRKFTLQKEDYIILKFSVDEPIYFKLGDFIDNETGLFELVDVENSKPTYNESTGGYDYELRLDAYYYKWKNKKFKYIPEHGGQEASWNLTASLDVNLGIFLRNLTALEYTFRGTAFEFSIDSTVENTAKLVSYDNTNMIDALTAMAEAWGCEWWVTDNIIHFGRCEFGDPVDFEIGVNVTSMSRSASQTDYATRIIAFGSDRNIPTNYRPVDEQMVINGVVQRRLMLPVDTPYVDAFEGMSQEEAVEDIVVFDDIYPRRVGTMSDITTKEYTDTIENEDGIKSEEKWNAYRFKDAGITFSKDYIIAGQQLKIKFESGSLNGMEFGVTFNPDGKSEKLSDGTWNPEAQLWEIVRNDDYGRNLPGDVLVPKNGDTYVLSGFDTSLVSDQYLPAAEQELKERTEAYVTKTKIDPSTYDCKMNSVYMFNGDNPRIFEIGDKVNLINKGYFKDGRVSRIIGFEYNLDKPYDNPVYTVGETAAYSRIGDIEDKVDAVTYKGQTYTGTGGSGVYIIRLNDSTIASNSNVFSALRQLDMFLRKNALDKAKEVIDFLKGLTINSDKATIDADGTATVQQLIALLKAKVADLEVTNTATAKTVTVSDKVTTLNAVIQALAKTHDLTVENTADIMNGIIREYLTSDSFVSGFLGSGFKIWKDENGLWHGEFDELTVRKTFLIFELVVQKVVHQGGMVIRSAAGGKLKKVTDGGTYWKCEHDSTDDFVSDDQVLCQTFTGTSMKRYWRLVTSAGAGYFNLSKSDCETGSANPEVGDEVAVLGNRTVVARQKAQIDCAVGDNAPYRDDYAGINSYSLVGKLINRTGNLSGITDPDFGALSDSGLYGINVYLKGIFRLLSGKTVETAISDAQAAANTYTDGKITTVETNFEIREGQISSKVTEATTAATNAGNSASTASTKASEAAGSASTAGQKATAASNSATAAAGSATTAGQKASDAQGAADDAADILSQVTIKESSINQTASNITLQVSEVTTKVTTATNAANTATTKAGEASASATNAKTSETNASGSASTAGSKATAAAGSATNAANSATSAADSASAASNVLTAVTTKQSEINQTASNITLQVTEVTTKTLQATNAAELATAMSKGKMLYRDPIFASGANGVSVYNNTGNGLVTHARVSGISGNPNGSGYCLRITTSGSASPGWGGFYFGTQTKANQVLLVRFVANIPSGYTVEFSSNATGSGGAQNWLTDHAGTGKWEEYAFKVVCGSTGSFSSTNFFYLSGGSTPTASAPLIWYVCYATVFDVTDVDDIPTRTEASNDAQSKANTAESNAKTYSNNTFTTKTEFSSQLTILNNSISTKVSQTDFNSLGARVGNAETTISQHTSQIALKASQSDLTALGTRVTSAEAKITPDAINLTVKSQTQTLIANSTEPSTVTTLDLRNLDVNTWYPVTVHVDPYMVSALEIKRGLTGIENTGTWTTHTSGFSLLVSWTTNGSGWGAIALHRTIYDANYSYANTWPLCNIGQNTMASEEYWYLRGGSTYQITCTGRGISNLVLHTAAYTWTSGTYNYTLPLLTSVTNPPEVTYKTVAELQTSFTMTSAGISMVGKTIAFTGLMTFSSFDSSTQTTINNKANTSDVNNQINGAINTAASDATTKANNALASAKSYSDTLKNSLGSLAYVSAVSLAKLDTTIVEGGYIKTSLIDAASVVTGQLIANIINATDITTGRLTVTDGANLGPFIVGTGSGSLTATSGTDSMLLSANLIRFLGQYSSVYIGADTFPSSGGGAILGTERIEVNRSITGSVYGNVGRYSSIQGATAYDDAGYQYTGNHVMYNVKGDICGFRLRARRVSISQTLSPMDSFIYGIASGVITLTLPSGAEDGQMYIIRKTTAGNINVVPASGTHMIDGDNWGDGYATSTTVQYGHILICLYDKVNNRWYINQSYH